MSLLTFGMSIAQGLLPHVTQSDSPLAAAVYKLVALDWVEHRGRNDLSQFLHVDRLDVHNVLEKERGKKSRILTSVVRYTTVRLTD